MQMTYTPHPYSVIPEARVVTPFLHTILDSQHRFPAASILPSLNNKAYAVSYTLIRDESKRIVDASKPHCKLHGLCECRLDRAESFWHRHRAPEHLRGLEEAFSGEDERAAGERR